MHRTVPPRRQLQLLIFGIDTFMSECRALTNLAGNSVATLVIARRENALDTAHVNKVLHAGTRGPRAETVDSPPAQLPSKT
ncbi:hypothetical protein [Streptomyces sp. NPDC050504]|uniref:hypothetical protein n=1 Tax=Streptomyces sp. NPDC050504 TaxID=3365618 RepID=UPI0037B711C8